MICQIYNLLYQACFHIIRILYIIVFHYEYTIENFQSISLVALPCNNQMRKEFEKGYTIACDAKSRVTCWSTNRVCILGKQGYFAPSSTSIILQCTDIAYVVQKHGSYSYQQWCNRKYHTRWNFKYSQRRETSTPC